MCRMSNSPKTATLRSDPRLAAGLLWATKQYALSSEEAVPVSGDASFRRYFRLQGDDRSLVLMDAPPERENSQSFVDIDRRLRAAGAHAPEIIAADLEQGFLLLEDLGDTMIRELLHTNNAG